MPRKGPVSKREVLPDPLYGSKLVTKFVNRLMYGTLGVEIWSPFPENPHPTISAKIGAPRFTACS